MKKVKILLILILLGLLINITYRYVEYKKFKENFLKPLTLTGEKESPEDIIDNLQDVLAYMEKKKWHDAEYISNHALYSFYPYVAYSLLNLYRNTDQYRAFVKSEYIDNAELDHINHMKYYHKEHQKIVEAAIRDYENSTFLNIIIYTSEFYLFPWLVYNWIFIVCAFFILLWCISRIYTAQKNVV